MTSADPLPTGPAPAAEPPARSRRRRSPLLIVVLALIGAVVIAALAWLVVTVIQLQDVIERQTERIEQQEDEISDLNDLVDERDAFSAAMDEYRETVASVQGVPMADIVPADEVQALSETAWEKRRTAGSGTARAERLRALSADIAELRTAAEAEAATNASGTLMESVLDQVSRGYARLTFDDVDALCERDVVGCVTSDDPYVVHFDQADMFHPSMDDWARHYVTLHEFAHVLQYTNPVATAAVESSFDDDWEFMADCYALRELNAWSLHRQVWINSYEYWENDLGYGRVCDAAQREVIASWLAEVGVRADG
ncbi:hypothetical protein ACFUTX_11370 [Microbacterium sp. NPDC057407]|uniref:hypothetical protein n=1 Tax=Microbacterium sp. NPDC057407 TaxID=3346120 RepID=UPI00366B9D2E